MCLGVGYPGASSSYVVVALVRVVELIFINVQQLAK
jgi:hypothetical protein